MIMIKRFINWLQRFFKRDDYTAVNYEGVWSIKTNGHDHMDI